MAELKRCNSIADVEKYLLNVDPELEVTVSATFGYYYIYDQGEILSAQENFLYEGEAGKFHCLPEIY